MSVSIKKSPYTNFINAIVDNAVKELSPTSLKVFIATYRSIFGYGHKLWGWLANPVIKAKTNLAENTIRKGLKEAQEKGFLRVFSKKIQGVIRQFIFINCEENKELIAKIEAGEVSLKDLTIQKFLSKNICSTPSKFEVLNANFEGSGHQNAPSNFEGIKLKEKENVLKEISSKEVLSNSLLEASEKTEKNVDDVFVNINNQEETAEEIRKILREGLNEPIDKNKEAFVQRETQKYLESITKNIPLVPGPQEAKINIESDLAAKKVRELLETATYFYPQKDKWGNINFDEKLIHKFSKVEKTRVTPKHVEICINKMKLKQGLKDPASYLCILLQNPSSSKTGNQIALETQEEKRKKDTLISFYETLTGKAELIDETRIHIFLKKEFYCNVLEKFKVSKEEIIQRVNRAKELFGEEFTMSFLPSVVKQVI